MSTRMAVARLLADTSCYAFKEWKGSLYPEKIKPEAMLKFVQVTILSPLRVASATSRN